MRLPAYLCLQRVAVKHLHIDSGRKISFHFLFNNTKYTAKYIRTLRYQLRGLLPRRLYQECWKSGCRKRVRKPFNCVLTFMGSGLSWTNATHKSRYVVCMYQLLGAIGFSALMLKGAGKKQRGSGKEGRLRVANFSFLTAQPEAF